MNPDQTPQPLASIRFLTGPLTNSMFHITSPITTIGRDRSNDITISDQKVSRFHARLIYSDGAWEIEKVSQTSTVTVNHEAKERAAIVVFGLVIAFFLKRKDVRK